MIRELSTVNPFWGAPRIHGELLKLGISVSSLACMIVMARLLYLLHDRDAAFAAVATTVADSRNKLSLRYGARVSDWRQPCRAHLGGCLGRHSEQRSLGRVFPPR